MTKCKFCKKSSHLLIKCVCNEEYCTKCRLPEKHNCKSIDIKKVKETYLLDNKVIDKKIDKI